MSKSQPFRDVTIFFRMFRNLCLGRKHGNDLRYSFTVSTRSPDPPQLPAGPHSVLSANYYCTRDARHEVLPPLEVAGPLVAAKLESGEQKSSLVLSAAGGVTPGKIFHWDAPEKDAYEVRKSVSV